MHTLLPLLLAVTAGARSHREERVLVVDDTPRSYQVRVAPHRATLVEFSEPFSGLPACAACAPGNPDGLFRLDASPDGTDLTIRLARAARTRRTLPDGRIGADDEDYLTVVVVPLKTSTVTVYVKYVPKFSEADPSVAFVVRRKVRAQGADPILRALAAHSPLQPRGRRVPTADPDRAFAEPHSCAELSGRSLNEQGVEIEAEELCRFGSRYYLRVSLLSHTHPAIDIGTLTVKYERDSSLVAADAPQQFIDAWQPAGVASAVVAWQVKDGEAPLRRYEVTAHESGGRGRTFTLGKIE
jgi:hypothetical protein